MSALKQAIEQRQPRLVAKPRAEGVDVKASLERTMKRFPKIMARLGE